MKNFKKSHKFITRVSVLVIQLCLTNDHLFGELAQTIENIIAVSLNLVLFLGACLVPSLLFDLIV